jgi:hypothetical protein
MDRIQLVQHRDLWCAVVKRVMNIYTHKMWRSVCCLCSSDMNKDAGLEWGCRTEGKRIAFLPGNEATDCPAD